MRRVFVGAGSNARPQQHLQLAADALAAQFSGLVCSPVVQSPARGGGAPYWNAVFAFDALQAPQALRHQLRGIEAEAGRVRSGRCCTLDLDLLLVGDVVVETVELTLPRPDILRDAFVLYPLALLAPALRHPTVGETLQALWAEQTAQGVAAPQAVAWSPLIPRPAPDARPSGPG